MQSSSTKKVVTLSPLAIERVKSFISKDTNPETKKANGLRIFAAQGCCSYQYSVALENHPESDDVCWDEEGINVYIDRESAALLKGATIDFVETVQGSGFKVDNPNASSSCGCGNS